MTLVVMSCAPTAAAPARATACPNETVVATELPPGDARASIECLVNAERAARGLAALEPSGRLRMAAQRHARDMVARRYFDHESPTGGTLRKRVGRTGYLRGTEDWALGEDIGWGQAEAATGASMVRAWMESPAHRDVILQRRFRDIGVGIVAGVPEPGVEPGATFVLDLGFTR